MRDASRCVTTTGEQAVKQVVLIGGHDKALCGKCHACSEPAGKDIPEIPGWHDKVERLPLVFRELIKSVNIVHALRQNPHKVD